MLRIGAIGAAIGIGVEALIRGRETIHEASQRGMVRLGPILVGSGGGLQLSISF
jgi:hypothetical protein